MAADGLVATPALLKLSLAFRSRDLIKVTIMKKPYYLL